MFSYQHEYVEYHEETASKAQQLEEVLVRQELPPD